MMTLNRSLEEFLDEVSAVLALQSSAEEIAARGLHLVGVEALDSDEPDSDETDSLGQEPELDLRTEVVLLESRAAVLARQKRLAQIEFTRIDSLDHPRRQRMTAHLIHRLQPARQENEVSPWDR